jgi:uncharacterized protein (DUF4415 family)
MDKREDSGLLGLDESDFASDTRLKIEIEKRIKMKNTNREFLLDAIKDFPELKNLPHMDELIAHQLDDATLARLEAEFEAEMDANPPKDSDLFREANNASMPAPRKTPAAAPAPTPSSKTRPITIRVPDAVIVAYRGRARENGTAYQTLINRILKIALLTWPASVAAL